MAKTSRIIARQMRDIAETKKLLVKVGQQLEEMRAEFDQRLEAMTTVLEAWRASAGKESHDAKTK